MMIDAHTSKGSRHERHWTSPCLDCESWARVSGNPRPAALSVRTRARTPVTPRSVASPHAQPRRRSRRLTRRRLTTEAAARAVLTCDPPADTTKQRTRTRTHTRTRTRTRSRIATADPTQPALSIPIPTPIAIDIAIVIASPLPVRPRIHTHAWLALAHTRMYSPGPGVSDARPLSRSDVPKRVPGADGRVLAASPVPYAPGPGPPSRRRWSRGEVRSPKAGADA